MLITSLIRDMLQFNFRQNAIKITAILTLFIVMLLGIGVQSSEALLTMKLSDGTTEIIVIDDSTNDSLNNAGGIRFHGSIGEFDYNVTTAIAKPLIGSSSDPQLYLSSVDVSSNSVSGGTLTVTLSDTDFDANSAKGFISYIGGITSGTVIMNNYLSESNDPFAMDINIGTYTSYNQGAFSGSDSYNIQPTSTFSLTTKIDLTHGSGSYVSSFSSHIKPDITVVPEPLSSLLFITGAALMAGRYYRKSYKKNG